MSNMQNCYWSVRCDAENIQVFVSSFSFAVNVQKSLLVVQSYCQRMIHKTYFITTCKYQRCPIPWQKKYINVVLFGFSIFWKTAMMFMWCIVFQLVAIIKKKMELQKIRFLLITGPQPRHQSGVSSLSKLQVKYSEAFQESNITLSSSSLQPPAVQSAGLVRLETLSFALRADPNH